MIQFLRIPLLLLSLLLFSLSSTTITSVISQDDIAWPDDDTNPTSLYENCNYRYFSISTFPTTTTAPFQNLTIRNCTIGQVVLLGGVSDRQLQFADNQFLIIENSPGFALTSWSRNIPDVQYSATLIFSGNNSGIIVRNSVFKTSYEVQMQQPNRNWICVFCILLSKFLSPIHGHINSRNRDFLEKVILLEMFSN